MNGIAFFRKGREADDFSSVAGRKYPLPRERITCADGFSLSVQAGEYLYSTPRENYGPWKAVEVGFPSDRPEPWDKWEKYCETPTDPTGTVYAYVPLTLVEQLVKSHGGEK